VILAIRVLLSKEKTKQVPFLVPGYPMPEFTAFAIPQTIKATMSD
jgi:hypothetical protein